MPGLSVCLIVRNEEPNLARALRSVRDVAEEIVVVDTGSTDRSVDIARGYGARVFPFPWRDDFAAARNYSFDQAENDWILWLDADEELLPHSANVLAECIVQKDALAFHLLREDLVDEARPDNFTRMLVLRLFRNRPDLRLVGRYHEQFEISALEEIRQREHLHVKTSSIALRHYGFIGTLRQQKLLRSAKFLDLELAERPDRLYYLIEQGRTLLLLGDAKASMVLSKAADQILRYENEPHAPMPLVAALFEYLLQIPEQSLPPGWSRALLLKLTRRWFTKAAPLQWILAQQAFARQAYAAAEVHLQNLVTMGREKSYDLHISFDPRLVDEDAQLNLGVCLARQAKLDEAKACFADIVAQGGTRAGEAKANLEQVEALLKKAMRQPKKRKGEAIFQGTLKK